MDSSTASQKSEKNWQKTLSLINALKIIHNKKIIIIRKYKNQFSSPYIQNKQKQNGFRHSPLEWIRPRTRTTVDLSSLLDGTACGAACRVEASIGRHPDGYCFLGFSTEVAAVNIEHHIRENVPHTKADEYCNCVRTEIEIVAMFSVEMF